MTPERTTEHATILVVDDHKTNLQLLSSTLEKAGYNVRVATSGEQALRQTQLSLPDMILLDIMMPGMDGYETCQQLKSDPDTAAIPVIFMTALTDITDKVKGFEVGAVDYVTKPFEQGEVLARVRTHIALRRTQQALAEKIKELEAYTQELETYDRTVAHDLKSPLGNVVGYASLLRESLDSFSREEIDDYLLQIQTGGQRLTGIIDDLLLLARVRKTDVILAPQDMHYLVDNAIHALDLMIDNYNATVILEMPEQWPRVMGYAPWFEVVWSNYLTNAIKYGGQPPVVTIGADLDTAAGQVCFWVADNGSGLSLEEQAQLFIPFSRLSREKRGHGLGLSIVQRIIERLNGQVGVESNPTEGSRFFFSLPLAP
jgi:two-component system sensor histidine kinase/response regulator